MTLEVCKCNHQTIITFFCRLFPVLDWLPRYDVRTQFLGDGVPGLLVGTVAIPQSISYSLLASQDLIYGIYTNFFCNIIYVAMATSRHNFIGSFGVLCLIIRQSVNRHLQLAGYNDGRAATVALSLSFLVGLYQVRMFTILLGVLQLGFVAVYRSEPLLSGFVTSSSLTIITSQMKYLLGLKIPCREGVGSFILMWLDLFRYIQNTNICDLLTSLIALAIIVPVKELNDRCSATSLTCGSSAGWTQLCGRQPCWPPR
uniref:SLC26A/SulP transporter domain-containing protein n=1 Tax=Anas zonorhyncha TaxID=75864 RepID=A0A8B9VBK8_9AVES